MVSEKEDKNKTDDKKIKKASLLQVVQHLNESEEQKTTEQENKHSANPPALGLEPTNTAIVKKEGKTKTLIKKEKSKKPVINVEKGDKQEVKTNNDINGTVVEEVDDLELEDEPYSKKKIRQEKAEKKMQEKKNTQAKSKKLKETDEEEVKATKPNKKKLESVDIKPKRERRVAAIEPSNTDKKLTRKERKEMKIKNKGAGISSKEFVRLLKEGEDKDLKDVPFESKGIMQLPTRTKADADVKKPIKMAKGQPLPEAEQEQLQKIRKR